MTERDKNRLHSWHQAAACGQPNMSPTLWTYITVSVKRTQVKFGIKVPQERIKKVWVNHNELHLRNIRFIWVYCDLTGLSSGITYFFWNTKIGCIGYLNDISLEVQNSWIQTKTERVLLWAFPTLPSSFIEIQPVFICEILLTTEPNQPTESTAFGVPSWF